MPGRSETLKQRILLADDDEPYLQATAMVLRCAGFDVTAVLEGNHAILALEVALLAKRPYDLLLLDLRMPGATGWEVLRYAREHTPPGVEPPRVLLATGFTIELDLNRVKSEGADGILLKPFMNSALVNEVRRVLSLHHEAAPATPPAHHPALGHHPPSSSS